jgi:hypothetical protein
MGDHATIDGLLGTEKGSRRQARPARRVRPAETGLAEEYRDNRNAYANAKAGFVERVLREAGVEPPPRDRLPE